MTGSQLQDILPLSPLQQGLLFHSLYDTSGLDFYTVQLYVELRGEVDEPTLRAAAEALVRRHANLRAVFLHDGLDEPVQAIRSEVELPWEVVDLSTVDESTADVEFVSRYDVERLRRFELDSDVLLRFVLFRLPGGVSRLALTLHHILVDGWSVPVLLDELFELYDRGGSDAGMAPVTPFKQYLAWLADQDDDAAFAAWERALDGTTEPALVAPSDRGGGLAPRSCTVTLTEELTARLTATARGRGWTLNTVAQAAWGIVLGRLLGRTDVVFGGTVSGRPADLPGVESMIGLFINTLPVRVRWRGDQPLATLLDELQRGQAELTAHQHVGLADLQRRAGVGELFDTTLVFENYPAGVAGDEPTALAGGARVTDFEARDSTHYAITVLGVPGRRLSFRIDYRPDAFEPALVARLGSWLERLLEAAAGEPDRPVGDLRLIDAGERLRVLGEWNDTAHPVSDTTLTALLAEQARRTPDATALTGESGELSYAELHARANRLARLLLAHGAGPDRPVAVALDRSADLVTTLLAALAAGAPYLPIDPALPGERIALMLADALPACVVSEGEAALPADATVLALDDDAVRARWDAAPSEPVTASERGELHPGNLAYVIYTSGSTGTPKGVGVPHGAIVNRLEWMQAEYGLTPADKVLQKTPFGFDVSVWEFFWPLFTGAELVLAKPEGHKDPAHLARLIREHGVTTVHFVPSMLEAFLAEPDAASCRGVLRRVVCSGEALSPAAKDACLDVLGAELHNLYGPTEAAVDVTHWACHRECATVPIGRPVWNTRTYVLDARLSPVPPGVPGELYLAGDQLARGYLARPGLTAERFVADPHGPPGAVMYRTGDLARWREDGALAYLGRVDDQVKLRGQRIEPGEIQAVLGRHPALAQAAVVVREDRPGDQRLAAYVVPSGAAPNGAELAEFTAASLPAHLVPSTFTVLDGLPVTANGKLDRRALPAPETGTGEGRGARTVTESLLCQAFAEVLGLDAIGADDDFFARGGHSLLATRLVGTVRDLLGVELSVRSVFEAPTAAVLAQRIDGGETAADPLDVLLPLRTGGDEPPLFCVHPAAGLAWCYSGLLGTLDPAIPVYGLQCRDPRDPLAPTSLGDRAADFVERIRAVRPHGPYRLLGWSVGGRLAHEIAALLRDKGEDVDLLAVLDSYPGTGGVEATREAVFADAFGPAGLSPDDLDTDEGRQRIHDVIRRELGSGATGAAGWVTDEVADTVLANYLATTTAMLAHTPRRFAGDLLLFAAPGERDPHAWQPYVDGRLDVREVDACHEEMTRRDVLDTVAEAINDATAREKEERIP